MNKKQEQQILDYYSTTDKYIRSRTHSNAHQTVFTKESDRYQWLVLEQKSQCEVEARQTDSHGTITARDNYELTTVNARFYVYPPKKKSDILYLVTDNPRTIVYNYFYTS